MASAFKSLKVQDVKELQELVAESVEAIESGMRLLDTRVLLGGATIDLLALDAEDRLTLVAIGLGADDEMLLRALEAYSWCIEYPDALRKLYPSVKLSESRPPRVIFVAERAPDAFLRKVKHLRLARAECLEFRFGLQFRAVEEMRGTDEAPPVPRPAPAGRETAVSAVRPAPVATGRQGPASTERPAPAEHHVPAAAPRPAATARGTTRTVRPPSDGRESVAALRESRPQVAVAEPVALRTVRPEPTVVADPAAARRRDVVEAPRVGTAAGIESRRDATTEVAEVHAQMLDQLRPNTTTVGEWRDAATKPATEVDEEKVRTVREYLQREFPTSVIYDFYAHDRGVQMFHLQDSHGALVHSAAVGEDLLDDAADAEVGAFLDKHKLARVLRQAGSAGVSVTKSGLKIERR
ncbi:MAG: hypothetical protein ACREM3_17960 [Candidatus Rokuibacteriota bacterium]